MRAWMLNTICALTGLQFLGAEPSVYRIAVLADTDKTEGGELATLIADELRRSKDVTIVYKSPDLTVSCFAINLDGSSAHGVRLAASVALMLGQRQLSEHFALTADSLKSLAHKVVVEVNKRELNGWRRTDRLRERPNQSMKPAAALRGNFSVVATDLVRGLSFSR
jgi:hypothetical protein